MGRPAIAIFTCSLLVVSHAQALPQSKNGQVTELAVVRHVGDLMNQTAVLLKGGSKVRVGLEARQAPQHSAVLIYALVDGADFSPSELGPLHLTLRRTDAKKTGKTGEKFRMKKLRKLEEPRLFATTLFLGSAGKYELEVHDPEDRLVARAILTATDEESHPWLTFTQPTQGSQEDNEESALLMFAPSSPGLPRLDGAENIPFSIGQDAGLKHALPRWRFEADPGLLLKAGPTGLHLASQKPLQLSHPEDNFLFRVWINKQPFVPKRRLEEKLGVAKRIEFLPRTRLHILVRFDPSRFDALPGDRIAIQLLYCPDGARPCGFDHFELSDKKADREDHSRWPLLTNKAEFVVPEN